MLHYIASDLNEALRDKFKMIRIH